MSIIDVKATVSASTSVADKKIDSFASKHSNTIRQMTTNLRRSAQILISLSAVAGGAIDQTLAMGIEAGLLTLELVAAAATAESVTSLGVTAMFQLGSIMSLIFAIAAAKSGRADLARSFGALNATFRMIIF